MNDYEIIDQAATVLARARTGCVFCKIVSGEESAIIVSETPATITIVPLNPVTDGHTITIPRHHVADAKEHPATTALTMHDAAEQARWAGDCNLITSCGPCATQTVAHLHIHTVPRRQNDGLPLPWTGQGR